MCSAAVADSTDGVSGGPSGVKQGIDADRVITGRARLGKARSGRAPSGHAVVACGWLGLKLLHGRTQHNLINIDIGRLFDGVSDCTGD